MAREDYLKYYIQGSDHYLIPKDIFDELFTEMENRKKEVQKYKEVIDKLNKTIYEIDEFKKQLVESYPMYMDKGYKLAEGKYKAQQKEFIEFLEKNWEDTQDIWYIKILNKYKEIIGVKDE